MKNYFLLFPCHKMHWQGLQTSLFTFLIILLFAIHSKAQSGNIDLTFVPRDNSMRNLVGFGINPNDNTGAVRKIVIQSDGKIVVGGSFQNFAGDFAMEGARAGRIARLNADGLQDLTFNSGNGFTTGFNRVSAMVIQPDNKILTGGNLYSYNTFLGLNNMARINPDGTRDQSFANTAQTGGTSINAFVHAFALQPDGKIIVGSNVSTSNSLGKIIRLNSNGTTDNTFVIGTGFSGVRSFDDANVYALALQTDGKVIAGGDFVSYNGTLSKKIIRLNANGSIDATFNIGTGFGDTDEVRVITLLPDGKLLVGGNLSTYNGTTINHIIRLNANGTRDNTFNIGTGFNNPIRDIQLQADGKILVGGDFTSFNNTPINRLVRLNADGSRDNTFNIGTGFSHEVYTIAIQPDGKAVVGGIFTSYNGVVRNGIVRLGGVSTVPTVAITGTLNPFTTCTGAPSATQTYTVSGSNLSANIAINAPTGFEISSNGTTFSNTLTLTAANSAVANTIITVRLAANATGTPSGNITHTSGTAMQNLAVSGTVNALPTITLGTIPSVTTTATSVSIPYTALTGSPNQYSITTGANALAGFVAVSNQPLAASPLTLALPTTKTAGTYNFNLTVRNSNTGCVSAVIPFSVVVGAATSSTFTITFSGTLNPFNSCVGSVSNVQTYTFSVTNMTEELAVTPPVGFQISDDANNYYTRITFTPPPSGAGSATISVRLAANATGTPSGNITHTSRTVTQNLAVSGTVNPIPTITLGTIPSINTRSTSFTIPYTATTGSPNQFSLTAGTNALAGFVPIIKQALTGSPLTISIPQNTVVGNYNFNLIIYNSVTGCESSIIPIILNNVMSVADEEFSNKIVAYPNPTSDLLMIQFPKNAKIEALRLLNSLGQEVLNFGKQNTNQQLQIDLSAYAAGVYYLYLVDEKKVGVKRISLVK